MEECKKEMKNEKYKNEERKNMRLEERNKGGIE